MAEKIAISGSGLDRTQLQQFLPDPRSVRAFEDMAKLSTVVVPETINVHTDEIAALDDDVARAQAAATAARAAGDRLTLALQALTQQLADAQDALTAMRRPESARIQRLEQRVADLESLLLTRRH